MVNPHSHQCPEIMLTYVLFIMKFKSLYSTTFWHKKIQRKFSGFYMV